VHEHGSNGDIGKAKDIVIKNGKVDAINSSKNLFFDLFLDCGGSGQFFECGVIETCSFLMSGSIGSGGMLGCQSGVCRELERNSSDGHVLSIRHDETKVTMAAATMCGNNCTCIGVNLFSEQFDGRVGGRSNDAGEC